MDMRQWSTFEFADTGGKLRYRPHLYGHRSALQNSETKLR